MVLGELHQIGISYRAYFKHIPGKSRDWCDTIRVWGVGVDRRQRRLSKGFGGSLGCACVRRVLDTCLALYSWEVVNEREADRLSLPERVLVIIAIPYRCTPLHN